MYSASAHTQTTRTYTVRYRSRSSEHSTRPVILALCLEAVRQLCEGPGLESRSQDGPSRARAEVLASASGSLSQKSETSGPHGTKARQSGKAVLPFEARACGAWRRVATMERSGQLARTARTPGPPGFLKHPEALLTGTDATRVGSLNMHLAQSDFYRFILRTMPKHLNHDKWRSNHTIQPTQMSSRQISGPDPLALKTRALILCCGSWQVSSVRGFPKKGP